MAKKRAEIGGDFHRPRSRQAAEAGHERIGPFDGNDGGRLIAVWNDDAVARLQIANFHNWHSYFGGRTDYRMAMGV